MNILPIAVSSRFEWSEYESGAELLRAKGYSLLAKPVLRKSGESYLNGTDPERLVELSAALGHEEARILWAVRGGYGLTRLLPQLTRPPGRAMVAGFSDVTALLWHLWAKHKKPGVHAPVMTKLANEHEDVWDALGKVLTGRAGEVLYPVFEAPTGNSRVSGVLMPGNLSMIAELIGTGSMPDLAGSILILEDIKEQPYRLDRMMTHLWASGCLSGVAAIVVGYLTECGDGAVQSIQGRCRDFGLLCFTGFPMGHESPNWPVPLGAQGEIVFSAGKASLRIIGSKMGPT